VSETVAETGKRHGAVDGSLAVGDHAVAAAETVLEDQAPAAVAHVDGEGVLVAPHHVDPRDDLHRPVGDPPRPDGPSVLPVEEQGHRRERVVEPHPRGGVLLLQVRLPDAPAVRPVAPVRRIDLHPGRRRLAEARDGECRRDGDRRRNHAQSLHPPPPPCCAPAGYRDTGHARMTPTADGNRTRGANHAACGHRGVRKGDRKIPRVRT